MRKESNCLVTGGSSNDVAPMAVLLMNIKATQSWIDHVIIFHDGISRKDQRLMNSIMPVEFIKYRFPGNRKTFNEIVRYVYREMVFCKYECFKLLERFEHVVWSDYDVVFLQDVPELVQDDGIGIKSLVYDPKDNVGTFAKQLRGDFWHKWADKLDINAPSIATGLFVLSRILPEREKLYRRMISATEQYGKYLVLPDQAVLNVVLQENKIPMIPIPWSYAYNPRNYDGVTPGIQCLHACSQPKFWNGLYNETWQKNYQTWLAMGGTPWKITLKDRWRKLKKSFMFRMHQIQKF
jgi:lipopolysaccharide biosynthesis glycosyltransferase